MPENDKTEKIVLQNEDKTMVMETSTDVIRPAVVPLGDDGLPLEHGAAADRTGSTGSTMSLISGVLGTVSIGRTVEQARPAEEETQEFLKSVKPTSLPLNTVDSEYEVAGEFARGGHGYIRSAFDRFLGRTVALKTLDEQFNSKNDYRAAFISEAQVMAQLDHPAIVPVYGLHGDHEGGLHMAMKLVHGKTLKQYLSKLKALYRTLRRVQICRRERRMLQQRIEIFLDVCAALSYVHYRNVIHRDLKPENIMLGKFSETYVMDWGIAEYSSGDGVSPKREKLQGTPQYIAPEVINRQDYDSRSDIYALGLILFEMVYLKPAYGMGGIKDVLRRAREADVDSYTHAFGCRVDRDLEMIVRKALSADVSGRYQNVKALANDLRNYRQQEEVSANPDGLFAKIGRRLRRHQRAMMVTSLIFFLGMLASAGFALYRHAATQLLLQEQASHQEALMYRRDTALSEAYSKGMSEGEHFNLHLKAMESLVSALARESALMLRSAPPSGGGKFYCYTDGEDPATAPPDFSYAPTYRQKISFNTFAYKEPPGEKVAGLEDILNRLEPLRGSFFRTIMSSDIDDSYRLRNRGELEKHFRTEARPSLGWAYIGLSNGLYAAYPYSGDYEQDYDPRKRPWYGKAASAATGRTVWSEPYVDVGDSGAVVMTCSQAIIDDDGDFLGVAGADIFSDHMREILEKEGNIGPHVKNKMLVDAEGRIVFDMKREETVDSDGDGKLDFRPFGNRELLREMQRNRNGRSFGFEDGVRYLYFYIDIKSLGWLYVIQIDYEKMLERVR